MNSEELKKIAVLREVGDEALDRLAAALEPKDYADGEAVFAEGDPGDSMYFIGPGDDKRDRAALASGAARAAGLSGW